MDHSTHSQDDDEATPDVAPVDGGAPATLDWVLDHVDRHVVPVDAANESAVMGAAWSLGFAGSTREQVWWVLRDARLRTAFVSICHAMTRVRPSDLPEWTATVMDMAPAERAIVARRVEDREDENANRIPAEDEVLFGVFSRHPDAVIAPDRRFVVVPVEALAVLVEVARSVTVGDIARLLDRARAPFERRLEEAAAIAADQSASFFSRRGLRAIPTTAPASASVDPGEQAVSGP